MSNSTYKNLVFKGGGVKSYAYVGAIETLEDNGVLNNIEKVSGSSAGALYASLLGIGCSASEIKDFILGVDLNDEMKNANTSEVLDRFFNEYGQYTGKNFFDNFSNIMVEKIGNKNVTFQELHDLQQHSQFKLKDIHLTGSDLSEGKLVTFSYETTPNMKLIDAVRISGSYPLMYTPVKGSDGHYYVDGGLLDNYPIGLFNEKQCDPSEICKANPETLGLYLGNHDENNGLGLDEIISLVENISKNMVSAEDANTLQNYLNNLSYDNIIGCTDQPITDLISYLAHLFYVYSIVHYPEYQVDEINIDVHGFNALDFDLNDQQKHDLISSGQEASEHFFHDHAFIA